MKTHTILLSAILMATAAPAFAQATSGSQDMPMHQGKQDMPVPQEGSHMKMRMNCMHMHKGMQGMKMGKNMPCANQTAQATGVIEAIDTAKRTVTIKHQAIPSIHWPAMTMTFKADPPSLLKGLKVGERVNFTLHPAGMNSTVTAIAPAKSAGH